jgi:type 2 lantibiotic biosynthesis protein LanM
MTHPSDHAADTWWSAALTLSERAERLRQRRAAHARDAASPSPTNFTPRLERWRAQRPFDRAEVLSRRLELDRLTEREFGELVDTASQALVAPYEKPRWVSDVEHASAIAHEIARRPQLGVESDASGLGPVRSFVEPFATAGLAELYDRARAIVAANPRAPFDAHQATLLFEPLLWGQLIGRALKVVILELNVARVRGSLIGDTPEERHASFAAQLRFGPARDEIIREYPVLARSLVTAKEYWAQASAEFLNHLATDATVLRDTFVAGAELGTITSVSGNAGDTHCHGRSVLITEFSSGTRIVFKPRSLAVDLHFNELVEWMNAHGLTPPLRGVRTIARRDHGWCEYVANSPCASRAEVERFYERFGAFVAILYALNATDFHYENVIASGEFPMLIDLEALFHPMPSPAGDVDNPEWLGWNELQHSVMRTGVLPFRAYDNDQSSGLDMSAMGGSGGQKTPNRLPVLVAAGTDEMRFERDFVRLPPSHNRPALGGDSVEPAAYADRVLSGFSRTYEMLLAHRSELLAAHGPIHRFANDPIRVVLRPTRQYALILAESNHPDVLRDALERDRLIDRLWVAVPARPQLEQVVQWEHEDLVNGDVPLFTSRPSSRDLFTTRDATIPQFFQRSGLASAVERIESMGGDDLQRQQWIMRASFVALSPARHGLVSPVASVPSVRPARGATPSRDEIAGAAQIVSKRLVASALRRDNRVTWLGLTLVRERDWVIQPVGSDLYAGSLGIALFLAYLDHVVGDADARSVARTVIGQLSPRIARTLEALDQAENVVPTALGAFGALGGAIYALSHIGALWNESELIELATRLTLRMANHLAGDRSLDLIAGSAGLIVAAAALDRVRPSRDIHGVLRAAAQGLVSRGRFHAGELSWTTSLRATAPLVGMSHGASGMALALLTAGDRLGERSFVDAALAAMRYERSTYDREQGDWPDYRILDESTHAPAPSAMWAWCHGAPGIGLVRLAALGVEPLAELQDDLERALDSTVRHGFGSNDSLCHGDQGNLELLVRAQELGHRGRWEDAIGDRTAEIVRRARRGELRCGVPGGVETPGFMTGVSGIGYSLLRLADTTHVPSILSLEPARVALRGGGDA